MSSKLIFKYCSSPVHPRGHRNHSAGSRAANICTLHQGWRTAGELGQRTPASGAIITLSTRTAVLQQRWKTIPTAFDSVISRHSSTKTLSSSKHILRHGSPAYSIPKPESHLHPTTFNAGKRFSSTSATVAESSSVSILEQGPKLTESVYSARLAWDFPQASTKGVQPGQHHGPLPLPIALKAFRPHPRSPSSITIQNGVTTITNPQQVIQPPPAIIGSQPLYYLARKFPILAEHELKLKPNKTALDYSSYIVGAMSTSFPSATTLRAVVRQFRKFLKMSAQQIKKEAASHSTGTRVGSHNHVEMELPRARIWTQTIRSLIWLKQYRRARVAIHAMQKLGIRPTGYAWRGICRGWIEQGELARAEALAVKVFTHPEISHDYKLEERPYYLTDMRSPVWSRATKTDGKVQAGGTRVRYKNRSPMSPNSAPLFLVIEALTKCGEMERARHWFDQIPPHEVTDMLTSDMVGGYIRLGQQDKAQEVIRIMARCGVKPTAIVFNPIVEYTVKHKSMEEAEELVSDMTKLGIFANLFTFKILIQGYIAAGQKDKAFICLDRLKVSGLETDRPLGRILLKGLWDLGELREGDDGSGAITSADSTTQETQSHFRTATLDFGDKPGWGQKCIDWIKENKLELAEETLHYVINHETIDPRIQAEAIQVIQALADRQDMTRARHWFEQLIHPDRIAGLRSANSLQNEDFGLRELMDRMVSGYIQIHQPSDAEDIIGLMSQQGIYPTVNTINLVLRWSTFQAEMKDAEGLVQRMALSGIQPNQETYEILCQGYASRGALDSLRECLVRMEEAGFGGLGSNSLANELSKNMLGYHPTLLEPTEQRQPSLSCASIFADMCVQWVNQNQLARAEQFVEHLLSNPHVQPELVPYTTLIEGWINQSQQNPISISAMQAMNIIRTDGDIKNRTKHARSKNSSASNDSSASTPSSSVPSSDSLLHEAKLYESNVTKMRKARKWFERTPQQFRTVELLNMMVGGYMALGLEEESEAMVQWMASNDIKPNVVTFNHILEHTVQHLTMPAAEGLVHKMRKNGIAPNVETWNLLIRGYVIRGQLGNALDCLDRMMGGKSTGESSRTESRSVVKASKTREIMEAYDREILDVVVHDDGGDVVERATFDMDDRDHSNTATSTIQAQHSDDITQDTSSHVTRKARDVGMCVEPSAMTEQLILAGFGPELRPAQGQGDYARAIRLYRNRTARQKEQEDQLMQDFSSLRVSQGLKSGEVENEEEWILDHLETFQELVGSTLEEEGEEGEAGKGGRKRRVGVAMTDLDWWNEIKWEEFMEMENGRERELSGRSIWPSL